MISRGEFMINGLRNKDLQPLLYTTAANRRRNTAVDRVPSGENFACCGPTNLIRKVPGSHRYHLTPTGRQIATAVITASHATVNMLIPKAA